jgi:hypothetical protein
MAANKSIIHGTGFHGFADDVDGLCHCGFVPTNKYMQVISNKQRIVARNGIFKSVHEQCFPKCSLFLFYCGLAYALKLLES